MRKNVILVDFKPRKDWEFLKLLNLYAPFDVNGAVSNKSFFHAKLGNIVSY